MIKKLQIAIWSSLIFHKSVVSSLPIDSMSAMMSTKAHAPGPASGTNDALFSAIERMQVKFRGNSKGARGDAEKPKNWGRFLDAGTGTHSLNWVRELPLTSWTAITADAGMQSTVEKEVSTPGPDEAQGNIVLGNWDDEKLLEGSQYDVVLMDYLIGAMDGFSPFKQDLIFDRMKPHLDPTTGIVYIIGLEPIPYQAPYPESIVLEVTRMRDACILLAGHRCYREYPKTWVERQLLSHGFRVLATDQLPILWSEPSLRRQLNVARTKLTKFKDAGMAKTMGASIDELDRRMATTLNAQGPGKRIKYGFDYIIAAEIDPAFKPATLAPSTEAPVSGNREL